MGNTQISVETNAEGCRELHLNGAVLNNELMDARFSKDTAIYATMMTCWLPLLILWWVHAFFNPIPSDQTQSYVRATANFRYVRGIVNVAAYIYLSMKVSAAPPAWQEFIAEVDAELWKLITNAVVEFIMALLLTYLLGWPLWLPTPPGGVPPCFNGRHGLVVKQIIVITVFIMMLVQEYTQFETITKLTSICKPYILSLTTDFRILYIIFVLLYFNHNKNLYTLLCHMTHIKKHDIMIATLADHDVQHLVNDFEAKGLTKPSLLSALRQNDLLTLLQKKHVTVQDPDKVSELIHWHEAAMAGRKAPVDFARTIRVKNSGVEGVDGDYELQRLTLYQDGKHVWKSDLGKYLYFVKGFQLLDVIHGAGVMIANKHSSLNTNKRMSAWCIDEDLGKKPPDCLFSLPDYWHYDDPAQLKDELERAELSVVTPTDIVVTGCSTEGVDGIYTLLEERENSGRRVWRQLEGRQLHLYYARKGGRQEKVFKSLPKIVLGIFGYCPKRFAEKIKKPPGWWIAENVGDTEPIYFLADPFARDNPVLTNDLAEDGLVAMKSQVTFCELSGSRADYKGCQSTCEKCGKPSESRFCNECSGILVADSFKGSFASLTNSSFAKNLSHLSPLASSKSRLSIGSGSKGPEPPDANEPVSPPTASEPAAAASEPIHSNDVDMQRDVSAVAAPWQQGEDEKPSTPLPGMADERVA